MKQIRLAIVDDSPFVRKALERILVDVPEIVVVGSATSCERARLPGIFDMMRTDIPSWGWIRNVRRGTSQ